MWNEFRHEQSNNLVKAIYPEGIHIAIANALGHRLGGTVIVQTATLDEPEHGLSDEVLEQTDVLIWWGHMAHQEVSDDIVEKLHNRVLKGLGLVVLHSGNLSKIFTKLMGTGCHLRWRAAAEMERIWCIHPGHPITDGLDHYFELPQTEAYGELFDVLPPDELIFISWFEGGEVFRSGCCWTRGKGRIFYFRPRHETYPIYHDANIQRVLANAVQYVNSPSTTPYFTSGRHIPDPPSPIHGH